MAPLEGGKLMSSIRDKWDGLQILHTLIHTCAFAQIDPNTQCTHPHTHNAHTYTNTNTYTHTVLLTHKSSLLEPCPSIRSHSLLFASGTSAPPFPIGDSANHHVLRPVVAKYLEKSRTESTKPFSGAGALCPLSLCLYRGRWPAGVSGRR